MGKGGVESGENTTLCTQPGAGASLQAGGAVQPPRPPSLSLLPFAGGDNSSSGNGRALSRLGSPPPRLSPAASHAQFLLPFLPPASLLFTPPRRLPFLASRQRQHAGFPVPGGVPRRDISKCRCSCALGGAPLLPFPAPAPFCLPGEARGKAAVETQRGG